MSECECTINETDVEIVKAQTQVSDIDVIHKSLQENNNDIIKTIIKLSSLKEVKRDTIPDPVFDEIRKIMDEKELIYHELSKHT